MFIIENFFLILKYYLKINVKFLIENLYYYNYFFLACFNFLDNIFLKKLSLIQVKSNLYFLDNIYYFSYSIICFSFNILNYTIIKKNIFDLQIYIGHHFLFTFLDLYKIVIPITFFFEMDSLWFNLYGYLITGKFIFSPTLKVYENNDLLKFLFNFKINLNDISILQLQQFINRKKYLVFNLTLNLFFNFFFFISS